MPPIHRGSGLVKKEAEGAATFLSSFANASQLQDTAQRQRCEEKLVAEFFAGRRNVEEKTKKLARSVARICGRKDRIIISICWALLRAGCYEKARIFCAMSLSQPKSANHYHLLGEIENALGNYQEAEAQWKSALTCDLEHIPSIISLRSLYNRIGSAEQLSQYEDQFVEATQSALLHESDLEALVVHHPWLPLKRLGPSCDGGYVFMQTDGTYDLLLAGGAGASTLFEKQFCQDYAVDGHIFDPTVHQLPDESGRLTFHQLAVGSTNSILSTNLTSYLLSHHNVFVKMDVEGSEFAWLESLSNAAIANIKQIVVELHGPFTKRRLRAVARLTTNHALVHVHANNYARSQRVGSCAVPLLLEVTFVRKDRHVALARNTMPLPTGLDFPNISGRPDTRLESWPFVST